MSRSGPQLQTISMPEQESNGTTDLESAVNKSQHHCEACQEKFSVFGQHYNDLEPRIFNLEERLDNDASGTQALHELDHFKSTLEARIVSLEGKVASDSSGVQALQRIEQLATDFEAAQLQFLQRTEQLEAALRSRAPDTQFASATNVDTTGRGPQFSTSELVNLLTTRLQGGESLSDEESALVKSFLDPSASRSEPRLATPTSQSSAQNGRGSKASKSSVQVDDGPGVVQVERKGRPWGRWMYGAKPPPPLNGIPSISGLKYGNYDVNTAPKVLWVDFPFRRKVPPSGRSQKPSYVRLLCDEAGNKLVDQLGDFIHQGMRKDERKTRLEADDQPEHEHESDDGDEAGEGSVIFPKIKELLKWKSIYRVRYTNPPKVSWASSGFDEGGICTLCDRAGNKLRDQAGNLIQRSERDIEEVMDWMEILDARSRPDDGQEPVNEDSEDSQPDGGDTAMNEMYDSDIGSEHEDGEGENNESDSEIYEVPEPRSKRRRGADILEASRSSLAGSSRAPKRRRMSQDHDASDQSVRRSLRNPKPTERASLSRQTEKRGAKSSQPVHSVSPSERGRLSTMAARQVVEEEEAVATPRSTRSQARRSNETGVTESTPRRSSRPIKPTEKDTMMITWKQVKEDSLERNAALRAKAAQRLAEEKEGLRQETRRREATRRRKGIPRRKETEEESFQAKRKPQVKK